MKICTKCKVEFELNFFCVDRTTKDGRHPWCRKCRSSKRMEWFRGHKEVHHKSYNQWYARNQIEQRVRVRKWHKDNKEWMKRYFEEWRKNNPDKINEYHVARDERLKGDFTVAEWRQIKKQYNYTCLACGRKEPEIKLSADHVVPVSNGGKHTKTNIQPLCTSCNSIKWKRTVDYRGGQYATAI